jgi:outer membrane lipoprotein-sorting protein
MIPAPTRRTLIALAAAGLCAASLGVAALGPAPARADAASDALVSRAIGYLDGVNNVKARFTQSDARGDVAQGTVYLARPGRARFEYDPSAGLLITSDGATVTIYNTRLNSVQHAALSSTPLAVFLADHVRLDRGAHITRVDAQPNGGFSITARDGHNLAGGEITLYFDDHPLRLVGWAVTDAQAHTTRVALGPFTPFAATSPAFFSAGPAPAARPDGGVTRW